MRLYDKSVLYWRSPPHSDLPPEVPWNLIPVRPRRRVQLQPGDVPTRYTGGGGRRRIEPEARETDRDRQRQRQTDRDHTVYRCTAITQRVDNPEQKRGDTHRRGVGTGNLDEHQKMLLLRRLTNLLNLRSRWRRGFARRRVKEQDCNGTRLN